MRFLPLDGPNTQGAIQLLTSFGLLPTVTEIDTFTPQVVKEFYSNLNDCEIGDDGELLVFVRGTLYEFSPRIINKLFQLPNHLYPLTVPLLSVPASLDEIAFDLSGGSFLTWQRLTSPPLTETMSLHNKICCYNWMSTVNRCALKVDRVTLLYMIAHQIPVNFEN